MAACYEVCGAALPLTWRFIYDNGQYIGMAVYTGMYMCHVMLIVCLGSRHERNNTSKRNEFHVIDNRANGNAAPKVE